MKIASLFPQAIAIAMMILLRVSIIHSADSVQHKAVLKQSTDSVPAGLAKSDWLSIRAAYEAGRHAVEPVAGGHAARNPGQQWRTQFDGRGFSTQPDAGGWHWGLELQSYGFCGNEHLVGGRPAVQAVGQRVTYAWDAVVQEWFVNDARGLEHGFTVVERPDENGKRKAESGDLLSFTLTVRGGLRPAITADTQGVQFHDERGNSVLNYSGLKVWDADGRTLPAHFSAAKSGLRILVDERGARYPLTIDPIAQQSYLKASNTGEDDLFGWSVAISGDTVVIGAPGESSAVTGVNNVQSDNSAARAGAAYVFVRSGLLWNQQAYLKASNTDAEDGFGRSIAISGDTIVVGTDLEDSLATGIEGDGSNNGAQDSGAVYVFKRSGTTWTHQAYIKANNTTALHRFGCSVGVSNNTIVVGAYAENTGNIGFQPGAAYVFVRVGSTWQQEAFLKPTVTVSNDHFGTSVAVSGDTIVVGATGEGSGATGVNGDEFDNSIAGSGAAYVFVRSGVNWTQQAFLKASNTGYQDTFGYSVAVDGNTVVVGAPFEDSNALGFFGYGTDPSFLFNSGAAYVFVRNGTTWSQQTYLKASNTDGGDNFGGTVAISGDTVVVGSASEDSNAIGVNGNDDSNTAADSGAAYVFVRSGTAWSQQAYCKASNTWPADYFGSSVAVSGGTVVVGATDEDSNATGTNGDGNNNNAQESGASYVYLINSGPAPVLAPEITVEQPAGTGLVDGHGSVAFGSAGAPLDMLTFTVRNVGTADLTGLGITKNGVNAADYTVGTLGASVLAPGASTTFTVTLDAAAVGAHVAAIHISSNDKDENPFDIALTAPEIAVEQPTATNRVDGSGIVDFGVVKTGSTNTLTFTVKNKGSAAIKGLLVTKDGVDSADFTVTGPSVTTLAANASTTFTVKFAPSETGARSAALHIANNDANENPFDIALGGSGFAITQQPAPQLVGVGEPASFAVTATGAAIVSYKWMKNGAAIPGAPNAPIYTIPATALSHSGLYSCLVTHSSGSVGSSSVRLGVVGSQITAVTVNEATTLTLKLTESIPTGAPTPTHQWKQGVTSVVNGGVSPAQVTSGATTATLSVTKAVLANAGAYICVVGMDGLTKESGPFNVSVLLKPVVNAAGPFAWLVSGPVTNLITAANGPTKFAFSKLPAGVTGNTLTGQLSGKPTTATATLSFSVIASNAAGSSPAKSFDYTVTALPSPSVGTFNGLVDRSTLLSAPVAGQMLKGHGGSLSNLIISSTGVFTGTLVLEDKSYSMPAGSSLSATAGGNPTASVVILRGTATDAIPDLTFAFAINKDTSELTGTLSDGIVATPVALKAWRSPWKATGTVASPANPATAASYTAALELDPALAGTDPLSVPPGNAANVTYPQGTGYGTLTITTAGIATWSGKAADGTPLTASTMLGPNGEVPLHFLLYTPMAAATAGSLHGWIKITGVNLDSVAPFDWLKLAQLPANTTRSYKDGFPLHNLTLIGGKYVKPVSPNIVLDLGLPPGNAQLVFSEGGIKDSTLGVSGALTQIFGISTTNTVDMPTGLANNPGTVTLKLDAATGAISGNFTLSGSPARSVPWSGVLVPRLSKGVGQFQLAKLPNPTTSPMLSGQVVLEAKP